MQLDPYSQWLGIPADQRPPNHYQLLGLPTFEADSATIKAAATDRIAAVRRYQAGPYSEPAIRLLGELARAFDSLSDSDRKAAYDDELLAAMLGQQSGMVVSRLDKGDGEWYCQVMGEELGPMMRADLARMIDQRHVTPHDLVRCGSGGWFPAKELRTNGESHAPPPVPDELWRIRKPAPAPIAAVAPATSPVSGMADTSQGIAAIVLGVVALALAPAGFLSHLAGAASIIVALVGLWLTQRDWQTLPARRGNGFGFTVAAVVICLLAMGTASTAAYMRFELGQAVQKLNEGLQAAR